VGEDCRFGRGLFVLWLRFASFTGRLMDILRVLGG
jgi:hypothetical protein